MVYADTVEILAQSLESGLNTSGGSVKMEITMGFMPAAEEAAPDSASGEDAPDFLAGSWKLNHFEAICAQGSHSHSLNTSASLHMHEESGTHLTFGEDGLIGWFRAAHRILRGKGSLSVIYPAPRLLELMDTIREARLTPKRFRLIYPRADAPANLALVEAVKDAKPLLHPMPPLIVYGQDGVWTEELQAIYHLRSEEDGQG